MKIKFHFKSWGATALFLALSAPLLTGCGGGSTASTPPPLATLPVQPPPASAEQLAVTARSTKAQWQSGEPVALEIEVKNVSDRSATLEFSSGQRFNFVATREGETQPAWNWAADKVFTQIFGRQTLSPGQSLKFAATWEDAAPGRYRVVGTLTANGGIDAAPFSVEIVR